MVGHRAADIVMTEGGTEHRPGGTPLYARRSLEALGVPCVVVERGGFTSRLRHHDGGVEQWVEAVGEPFAPDEVLAAVDGCDWVILGGQTAGDFPPETIAGLAEAGHRVCIDGQGLCRGDAPGPVRLRPFPPDAIRGVSILKLNRAEAEAAAGGLDCRVAARSWSAGGRRHARPRRRSRRDGRRRMALRFQQDRDLRRPHRRR